MQVFMSFCFFCKERKTEMQRRWNRRESKNQLPSCHRLLVSTDTERLKVCRYQTEERSMASFLSFWAEVFLPSTLLFRLFVQKHVASWQPGLYTRCCLLCFETWNVSSQISSDFLWCNVNKMAWRNNRVKAPILGTQQVICTGLFPIVWMNLILSENQWFFLRAPVVSDEFHQWSPFEFEVAFAFSAF